MYGFSGKQQQAQEQLCAELPVKAHELPARTEAAPPQEDPEKDPEDSEESLAAETLMALPRPSPPVPEPAAEWQDDGRLVRQPMRQLDGNKRPTEASTQKVSAAICIPYPGTQHLR